MYSPKIKEEYIRVLYKLSKRAGLPMTTYVNRIIGKALAREAGDDKDGTGAPGAEAPPSQKTLR